MATADELKGLLEKALDAITSDIKKIVDTFNRVVGKVEALAREISDNPLVRKVADALKSLAHRIKALVDTVARCKRHYEPVTGLIGTAFRWVDDVRSPVSLLSSRAGQPTGENLSEWTGNAKSEYDRKSKQQQPAIDDMTTKAEFVSQWLLKIAKKNVEYSTDLADMATDVLAKLIAAETAPRPARRAGAIGDLAEAVGELIETGIDALIKAFEAFIDSLGDVRDLAGQSGDYTALPDRHRPQAVHPA